MVLLAFALLIFLGIMGKIILLSSNQNWDLNPIELLCYRAYFDLYVLSKIVESNILTLGKITLTPNGEHFIGELLFKYPHNITTTLFGTIYLDFGILGVYLLCCWELYQNIYMREIKALCNICLSIIGLL